MWGSSTGLRAARRRLRAMLRPVALGDVRFMRDLLRHAYHWRLNEDPDLPVFRYVQNWGRVGDAGIVAFDARGPFGAAWYRLFTAEEPGFGFIDEQTPELTISVVPSRRGQGVGGDLLTALLERARADRFAAVSLSAQRHQTKLYERAGFVPVQDTGKAVTMRRALAER
jgi:GNAT superfamily N-acetyltransferase